MTHPSQAVLALYAGRDVGPLRRLQLCFHLRTCERCTEEVARFVEVARSVQVDNLELPAHIDWERLAAEMTANIKLGIEAGECVEPRPLAVDRFGWRTVVAAACLSGLLVAGWTLNIPVKPVARANRVEIRTTPAGIEMHENGGTLTLMHLRDGAQKPVIVSTPGSLRSRFVDDETGQVTINNVYAQ
jgi:hypothetical protein